MAQVMYFPQFSQMNDQFQALFNAAAEAILIADSTGDIVLINDRVVQLFGYEREELVGQPIHSLLPPRFQEKHHKLFESYLQAPRSRSMGEGQDLFALRKDFSEFPIEVSLSPLYLNDDLFVMSIIIDITRRKRMETEMLMMEMLQVELEKERELLDLKERFVSMVTHELRTPISTIASAATMLERYQGRLSMEKQAEYINRILNYAHHMAHLLDDVLTLSRARANNELFNPQPQNIGVYCQNVYDEFVQINAGKHDFRLVCEVEGTAMLDTRLLDHILSNLLTNAFKYTPAGNNIWLEVTRRDHDLIFRVCDEGIGIPPEDLGRLFEAFHRAHNVDDFQGTGLGLAIVQQNVEIHGGTINCVSKLGEGSTFTVILPMVLQ